MRVLFKRYWIIIIIVSAASLYFALVLIFNPFKSNNKEFFESEINGRIRLITTGNNKLRLIKLFGNNKDYLCDPKPMFSNSQVYYFANFAQTGDSVYKVAYNDTLLLIKNDTVYEYFCNYCRNWESL